MEWGSWTRPCREDASLWWRLCQPGQSWEDEMRGCHGQDSGTSDHAGWPDGLGQPLAVSGVVAYKAADSAGQVLIASIRGGQRTHRAREQQAGTNSTHSHGPGVLPGPAVPRRVIGRNGMKIGHGFRVWQVNVEGRRVWSTISRAMAGPGRQTYRRHHVHSLGRAPRHQTSCSENDGTDFHG